MKNSLSSIYLFVIIFFSLGLFSCQEIELEYSCDPFINSFIRENKLFLSQICVNELTTYELPVQRAIFNSWDFNKKREVWLDKLYMIIDNDTFSIYEKFHIQTLIEHISDDYFLSDSVRSFLVERSLFAEFWITYASEELDWSEKYIAFIVYRLYTDPVQMENELSELKILNKTVSLNSESGNCSCSTGFDYCGYSNCISGNCVPSSGGCGWLWGMACNGLCY